MNKLVYFTQENEFQMTVEDFCEMRFTWAVFGGRERIILNNNFNICFEFIHTDAYMSQNAGGLSY